MSRAEPRKTLGQIFGNFDSTGADTAGAAKEDNVLHEKARVPERASDAVPPSLARQLRPRISPWLLWTGEDMTQVQIHQRRIK